MEPTAEKTVSKTPADIVIELFGGEAAVAHICNISLSSVYRWRYPKERGGTAGAVPSRYHAKLLREAKKQNLILEPAHLILIPADDVPESASSEKTTEGADIAP